MGTRTLVSLLLGLIIATPVTAGLMTVSADDYATGTILPGTVNGVQFESILTTSGDPNLNYSPVYITDAPVVEDLTGDPADYIAAFGTKAFGWSPTNQFWFSPDGFPATDFFDFDYEFYDLMLLGMRFVKPTDYVSLQVLQTNAASARGTLLAFDSAGHQLFDPLYNPPYWGENGYSVTTMELTSTSKNIAYVIFGGEGAAAFTNSVSFAVPEPSSIALLALGLILLGFRGRQSKFLGSE